MNISVFLVLGWLAWLAGFLFYRIRILPHLNDFWLRKGMLGWARILLFGGPFVLGYLSLVYLQIR